MAVNAEVFGRPTDKARASRRPSDRGLFLAAGVLFPLLVLAGYFKSYYFSAFFDVKPLASAIVHAHGIVMSAWVIYFVAQIALIRSKNIKLHMTMGMAGVALAAIVVVVGLMTAWDAQMVRNVAPPGAHPHSFFLVPVFDMLIFVLFFAGAIYYRKRPAEHKTLMLLTALNFVPAALFRLPILPPEQAIIQAFGGTNLLAFAAFGWYTYKHRSFNKLFAGGFLLMIVSLPLRIYIGSTETWLKFADWMTS
jgi:hypothetical protein